MPALWSRGPLADRLVAAGVFVYALVIYLLTMAPTASFWDSGEFIAIAHGLQVSHPPGAPFYMLVGRFFSMVLTPILTPFVGPASVAVAINLVSVLASALTVLLTHLVIVRLVRIWKGRPETWTRGDRLIALGGGVIGACAFAVTDSFWFNAVEAEVYALSMLFTALVVWLILVWRDETMVEEAALRARGEHPFGLKADRRLLLIAYLFGLAIGVHLLNVLTLFFIALIVFFLKVDRPDWTTVQRWIGIVGAGVVAALLFFAIYPGIIQMLPDLAERSGAPVLTLVFVIAASAGLVWWSQKTRRPVLNLLALSAAMVLIGYSTYGVIFIRSAADPPIDENDPETAEAIVSYLKREQYGSTPLLKGESFDQRTGQMVEKSFPRRWSPDGRHQQKYAEYGSDLAFFWDYQVNHMYTRYFLWNFMGKASDEQDAPAILFAAQTDPLDYRSPSERSSRNTYFALPLLLGLLGMAWHFMRDWRRGFAVGVLFLVTGIGIILYLNQTPFQPRERDYSYVASFFAFALWIGIGASGLVELVLSALRGDTTIENRDAADAALVTERSEALEDEAVAVRHTSSSHFGMGLALAALLFALVPGLMLWQNYADHDRSGRYMAPEFAANMLNSTAPNAIIFTNGDNDTFPLWYAQEVEGIRRDVRVVNLSLLNTPWYAKQLRDQWSRESAPLPITLPDEAIDNLGYQQIQPREVEIPVDPAAFYSETASTIGDTSGVGPVRWQLDGRPHPFNPELGLLTAADQLVLNMLFENARNGWERPIYFATTVARDAELGLENYMQNEGLARRVVPVRSESPGGRVVPEITADRLAGFQFTGLADPDVYYDQNARQMADNYRAVFAISAEEIARQGRPDLARELLDRVQTEVSEEAVPADFYSLYVLSNARLAAGDTEGATPLLERAEALAVRQLAQPSQDAQRRGIQYLQFIQRLYADAGAYERAAGVSRLLADFFGDESLLLSPEQVRDMHRGNGNG
jgi:hypothetical protein